MKLVIAEKPSVAQSIAKVIGATERKDGFIEGNGYIVSWCVGHLIELANADAYDPKYKSWNYEDLPIIPEQWQYVVSESTKKQYDILCRLMKRNDVTSLVCATDAGREGELIFRLVYYYSGCKKPFERLWISSMEDPAIRDGFRNLRPSREYDALYTAALCRERADWIIGINGTRLFSVLYRNNDFYGKQTLNVGRVMTPTLAMVVQREQAINNFVPETFYTVQLVLDGFTASSERFKNMQTAQTLCGACIGQMAQVAKTERKEKSEKPPALYDLTSLQRDANRMLGYTAQQTLNYTQSLYEKKLVTYPRTDSRYLTDDMAGMLPSLVNAVFSVFPVAGVNNVPVHAAQVINSAKVTDHHAIIPTREVQRADLTELSAGERDILQLIATRLMVAVGDPHRYEAAVIELQCGGAVFTARGKTVLYEGWKALLPKKKSDDEDKEQNEDQEKEQKLPSVSMGQMLPVRDAQVKEGKTSPPKRYTENTLLRAMETASADEMPEDAERKGLGTPATRAGIIEKLVSAGFLERSGKKKAKNLLPTQRGITLISIVPEQLKSASMTAEWEEKLLFIQRGEYAWQKFMVEIAGWTTTLVKETQVVEGVSEKLVQDSILGKCPICGQGVIERQKSYSCSDRNCKFAIWKDDRFFQSLGKKMTKSAATSLITTGKVKVKGCVSKKTGNKYDATIVMTIDSGGRCQYAMEFADKKHKGKRRK